MISEMKDDEWDKEVNGRDERWDEVMKGEMKRWRVRCSDEKKILGVNIHQAKSGVIWNPLYWGHMGGGGVCFSLQTNVHPYTQP